MQNQQVFLYFNFPFKVSIFAVNPQNKGKTNLIRLFTMASFGKKIAALRKEKKLSQTELAKQLNTSVSVISRYERDEMTPSIDAAKKLANILETTVGYLLGETEEQNLFKDPAMLQRLNDISSFSQEDQEHILYTLDALIKNVKLKSL